MSCQNNPLLNALWGTAKIWHQCGCSLDVIRGGTQRKTGSLFRHSLLFYGDPPSPSIYSHSSLTQQHVGILIVQCKMVNKIDVFGEIISETVWGKEIIVGEDCQKGHVGESVIKIHNTNGNGILFSNFLVFLVWPYIKGPQATTIF